MRLEEHRDSTLIRPAVEADRGAIVRMLLEAFAAGDSLTPDGSAGESEAVAYWWPSNARVFVAELEGAAAGSYMLRPNQPGRGAHVANAGYVVDRSARGRGLADRMCAHSIETARRLGFLAMQFNFVVSTNVSALRIWERHGFRVVGRLPGAFRHARLGPVDALVMFLELSAPPAQM